MKKLVRRLSISLLILMLSAVFTFAGSESGQETESSAGFKPYQSDAIQLTDGAKKAIESGINSSLKK